MNWKIAQLERDAATGLVLTAHWTLTAVDGDYTANCYGSLTLPAKDPQDESFVPFENLTEAQVVEWVKEVMGSEQVASYEGALLANIELQKNPQQVSGVPW
jgi:hypothetical protein